MNQDDDDFELEGDLDLDSALDAWAQDFEQRAKAESAPMPQTKSAPPAPAPAPAPAPPQAKPSEAKSRPLYQPDPELLRGREVPKRPAPAPPASFPTFDDDDDEEESTKIAMIPKELIASLQEVAAARAAREAEAEPKPRPRSSAPPRTPVPGIDLDLDDLFDGLDEQETRISELPARTAKENLPTPEPTPRPASERPQVAEEIEAERSIEALETDFLDPFSEDERPVADPVGAQAVADPVGAQAAEPAPAAEEPPAPPKPAMPAIPRPSLPKPVVPAPGKPAGAKPGLPLPVPSVASRPLPPRPPAPAVPGALRSPPRPAAPAWKPPAPPPGLARPADDVSTLERPLDESTEAPVLETPKAAPSAPDDGPELSFQEPGDARLELSFEDKADDEPALSFEEPAKADTRADDDEPDLSFEEPAATEAETRADDDEPDLSFDEPATEADTRADDDAPGLSFEEDPFDAELAFDAPVVAPALSKDDDDEPDLSFAEPSDEPAAPVSAEDDEPDLSFDADEAAFEDRDSGLSDLAPPRSDAPPSAAPAPSADHGAATAQRTVRQRKPRAERFAFVGRDADTQRRRGELLHELAQNAEGAARARLLTAAAELHERLGEPDAARDAYRLAREADPTDVVVLRALRHDALRRRDFSEAADLLLVEAELPLGTSDRAHALTLLAELQLVHLADPSAAEESARHAHAAAPTPVSALLVAEARRSLGDAEGALAALELARGAWATPEADAALGAVAAFAAERAGRPGAWENASDGLPVQSGLGRARTTAGAPRAAALTTLAQSLTTPTVAEVFRRLVAITSLREDPAAARDAVRDATRPASLRARARASRLAHDAPSRATALEALARATGSTERALALVELAEARAELDDLEGASAALRDAAVADERLDTIRVVREILSRRADDPSRLAAQETSEASSDETSAVARAARLVRGDDRARERAILDQARERGESPLASELAMLDAAAEEGATEVLVASLARQSERLPPERRAGTLLALSLLADGEAKLDALRAAAEAAPSPTTIRALARTLADAADVAATWEREAAEAVGERAFHAWYHAGLAFREAGLLEDARRAFERAFDELPGPSPATWALERDPEAPRVPLLERMLDVATSARAGANAAAALAWSRQDAAALAQALEHADRAATADPALDAWVTAHVGTDATTVASLSEARAAQCESPAEKRLHLVRAALAHEQAGDPRSAALALRTAREIAPDPLATSALDRVEIAAGEHARVSERRFEAVKAAQTPEDRLPALEALADLDLHERDDMSAGVLTLRSILEEVPGHLPTLRALERHAMRDGDDEALGPIVRALATHLPAPEGVATPELVAHARAAVRLLLARAEVTGDAADETLRAVGARLSEVSDDWLLRHLAAAATDDAERAQWKGRRAQRASGDALERSAELLDAAEAADLAEGPGAAALLLAPTAELRPEDPITAERRGVWLRAAGEPGDAGVALALAAAKVGDPIHAVRLYYDAGRAHEDAGDAAAATECYERASEIDVRHGDLFERARGLLEAQGDQARLAALVGRRVEAGADTRTLVELHENRAKIALGLGDRHGAREALKAALGLDPQRVDALKRLSKLQLEDHDWRGAAESLIRIARLRQDRDELRWVFFTLGDIYDRHLPEPKRAEAAFRRVLKLLPDDLEALDRLASLFEREAQYADAVPVIEELLAKEIDPDEQHRHLLRLALAHERRGDPRSAEHVLDDARKKTPTDLVVLRAMADLYERQRAPAALAMHLGRATGDFRRLVEEDATSHESWSGLVEVLEWKDRRDAARACASVAVALGVQDVGFGSRLDSAGGIPGAGPASADPDLRDAVAPRMLNRTVFEVFRLAGEAFDKALPFDARAWRAEKLPSRGPSLRDEALRAARSFGITDVQVLVTSAAPRLCVAVGDRPATILVGHDLAASTTEAERAFLFTRALGIIHAGLAVVMRSQPEAVNLLIGGLLKSIDGMYANPQLEARALEDMAKRVGKNVPRKNRDALVPLAIEMGGAPGFDPARLGLHAAELGDRLALLALGAIPASFSALLALANVRLAEGASSAERVAATKKVPEAWSLVRFAISDPHFDARHRAGVDRL
ncbi:MAG: hypothetical protein H6723_05110 [Sandaracinus sp.]|nr:hypothetical protein [Sandaracinus sp.]